MANFATTVDVEAFLQHDLTTVQVIAAERALGEATADVQNYCKQVIELVEDDEITLDVAGGTRLYLPELPVVSVASVVEDGEALVAGDDYQLGRHGILHRAGASWASGIQIVTVTYTHGYATIPDDIAGVVTRAAARAVQAGMRAAESAGVPGVASKSLGDFSVTYTAEGAAEGVMGASAARMLLLSEKDILNFYRMNGP